MDLGAYANIEALDQIAKENGIDIPRLRGYRLMKDEEPVSKEKIEEMKKECEVSVTQWLCEARPFWNPNPICLKISCTTDVKKDYFLICNPNKEDKIWPRYVGVRWDRIHGWKRKILKFEIKKQKREIQRQFDTWNKYVGRPDVLYIHSRMGGGNWDSYDKKPEITRQPWFLDRVDDCWDSTYCDFYAKIKTD